VASAQSRAEIDFAFYDRDDLPKTQKDCSTNFAITTEKYQTNVISSVIDSALENN